MLRVNWNPENKRPITGYGIHGDNHIMKGKLQGNSTLLKLRQTPKLMQSYKERWNIQNSFTVEWTKSTCHSESHDTNDKVEHFHWQKLTLPKKDMTGWTIIDCTWNKERANYCFSKCFRWQRYGIFTVSQNSPKKQEHWGIWSQTWTNECTVQDEQLKSIKRFMLSCKHAQNESKYHLCK